MTAAEYAIKLEKQLYEITAINRPFQLGVATAHALMTERIFDYGQDVNNNEIGQYSEKGIYINPKKTATQNNNGFSPLTGKTGKSKFADGKPHVTSYFEGWKGFRSVQRLRTDYVNLKYTGDLFSEFATPPKKISVNEYEVNLDEESNINKARGNEEHFHKVIFKPSKREIDVLLHTIETELKLILS